jgi:hypothetical protein
VDPEGSTVVKVSNTGRYRHLKNEKTAGKPTVSFEDGTVYKLSYFGTDGDTAAECRSSAVRRQDNFLPAGRMSSDTTHRHDYRC